jgi:hypothetical protein
LQQPWVRRYIQQRLGSRLDASPQVKETEEEHLFCPQTNDTGHRCGNVRSHLRWRRCARRIDQPIPYDDVDRARHFHSGGPAGDRITVDSRDPTKHHRHHSGTDNNYNYNYHHHHDRAGTAAGDHRTGAASKSVAHRLRAAFPTLRKAAGPNGGSCSEQQQLEQ